MGDQITSHRNTFLSALPMRGFCTKDVALLAKTEMLRRLLIALDQKDKSWRDLIPVHIRGLQEADRIFC